MVGDEVQEASVHLVDCRVVGITQAGGARCHHVQDRPHICWGAADDAQDFRGRRLPSMSLLQLSLQFLDQLIRTGSRNWGMHQHIQILRTLRPQGELDEPRQSRRYPTLGQCWTPMLRGKTTGLEVSPKPGMRCCAAGRRCCWPEPPRHGREVKKPRPEHTLGRRDARLTWPRHRQSVFKLALSASHALAGRKKEARAAMQRLRQIDPTLRMSNLKAWFPIHRSKHRKVGAGPTSGRPAGMRAVRGAIEAQRCCQAASDDRQAAMWLSRPQGAARQG